MTATKTKRIKLEMRVCTKCEKRRNVTRYVGTRGRVCDVCRKETRRASHRKRHLDQKYELTPEQYDALLAEQGHVCAICKGERPYNLHVDHDHAVEAVFGKKMSVRGLLCKRCNKLLADVADDPDLLMAAVAYLFEPPARRIVW